MSSASGPWIWQQPGWPDFVYDPAAVNAELAAAYRAHGVMEGKAGAIGLGAEDGLALAAMTDEVLATAEIEGEHLPLDAVRSSVMRRMGLAASGPRIESVEGLVAVVDDATTAHGQPLDEERLFRWQQALFPNGFSGLHRIATGRFRDHEDPMQIVSGLPGREVVHYVAPASVDVPAQMRRFLAWFAATTPPQHLPLQLDGFARAAIAHLWFESIHPFEDGNGRIGRALIDMAVAQHMGTSLRLFSLSRELLRSRADYYDRLNRSQRGGMDVTEWVRWFAGQCAAAYTQASVTIDQALLRQRFNEGLSAHELNERQRKVLQRLLADGDGGFKGGLNADKYMKMTGASKATATRDLSALAKLELLWTRGAGKAMRYYVAVPGWTHGVASPEPRGSTVD